MQSLREAARPLGTDGCLRAALNFGNRVLISRARNGEPAGITAELARLLARDLDLQLQLVPFDRAVDVADSATDNVWDLCFLAIDPLRGRTIAFTDPYVRISGSYLVAGQKGTADSIDALRVGVVRGSAYTLYLARQPGADRLVEFASLQEALAALDSGHVGAIAGIEQVMRAERALRGASQVLEPPFMEIRQAVGVPIGKQAAISGLQAWLEALKQNGQLAEILELYGLPASCVDR